MPNWCENELDVSGDESSLREFWNYAMKNGRLLDMNRFIPYPEKYKKLDRIAREHERENPKDWANRPKDGYNQGGYEWCIQNWGTKWNFCGTTLDARSQDKDENGKRYLYYSFETAWSPPRPVILKMSEMFPDLRFELRYFEGGVGFQGEYIVKAGKVIDDDCRDYVNDQIDEDIITVTERNEPLE